MTITTPGPHALGRRYALSAHLGSGASGNVYRAVDVRLDRPVAVKVFQLADATPHEIRRYAREARILSGLSHPGLVALLDVGADVDATLGPVAFLVMELVDGETLRGLLRRGRLEPRAVAGMGQQLATALGHAHGSGVVHRDVKPSNVLVAADRPAPTGGGAPTVLLADFGIALAHHGRSAGGDSSGTAGYHSPEQALGRPLGPATDVYSLGLVLLECLTGRRAYPGAALSSSLARLLDPVDVPADLGDDWGRLLRAMTADEPHDRPATAAVAAELRALAAL